MVNHVSSRAIQNVLIPLIVTVIAAFFGMFLPMMAGNSHNVVWESLYGIGFYLAGLVARGYVGSAFVGLVGLVVWPLLACGIVFLLARLVVRSSLTTRRIVGVLFAASLFAFVSRRHPYYT